VELAGHVVDVDTYHTVRDKSAYNHGLFWHTYHYGDADIATHRTYPLSARGRTHGGGPSADHNYTTGLMLHYFLTGDIASRDTVVDSAQYVIDIDDGALTVFRWVDRGATGRATMSAGYVGPGRGPANSLNALIDGYRLSGDRRFADKAAQIIRRVIHPEDDVDRHELDVPERRWFYTMFLQSLGKYLAFKAERGEVDDGYAYGRASLLHYARWMAEHEYPYLDKPERLEFPTETWAAQDIRKSDVFCYAAMHSSAGERDTFIERETFFFRAAIDRLQRMPTRSLARPVVILLTSGFLHGWRRAHPDAVAPEPRTMPDFGSRELFTPQRERALRRVIWIAGSLAAAAAALFVSWFRTGL